MYKLRSYFLRNYLLKKIKHRYLIYIDHLSEIKKMLYRELKNDTHQKMYRLILQNNIDHTWKKND